MTTILKRFNNSEAMGSASGFFYSGTESEERYLVTNKHVIYGEEYYKEGAKPEINKIKMLLHTDKDNLGKNEEAEIPLIANGNPIWKEHKNVNVDVVCIPVELNKDKFTYSFFTGEHVNTTNLVIEFEKIFIMGYPYGWYDTKHNLPIMRVGHLSSPFGVPFKGNPYMLGDVETHRGMSGSPAILILKNHMTISESGSRRIHIGVDRIILAGVFSGQPIWEQEITEGVSHTLCNIWFARLIEEILTD